MSRKGEVEEGKCLLTAILSRLRQSIRPCALRRLWHEFTLVCRWRTEQLIHIRACSKTKDNTRLSLSRYRKVALPIDHAPTPLFSDRNIRAGG